MKQSGIYLLLAWLLFLGSCQKHNVKSTGNFSALNYDSAALKVILDTMHAKALIPVDEAWCDSVLRQFSTEEMFRRYPDLVLEAYRWSFIAYGYSNRNNIDSFKQLMAKHPVERLMPWIVYMEARVEVKLANQNVNETATLKFLEALDLFLKQNNKVGVAMCSKWLGFLYMQSGQYEKSIAYSKKALVQAVDYEEKNILYDNIYRCYDYLEQYDSADYYIENDVSPYKLPYAIDTCKYNYYLRGKIKEADEFFTKNLTGFPTYSDTTAVLYGVKVYCHILIHQKRFKEAEKYVSLGLAYIDSSDSEGLYKIARLIYDSLGNYRLAYKYLALDRALENQQLVNSSRNDVEAWLKKSEYKLKEQQLNFEKEIATQQLIAQRKQNNYFIGACFLLLVVAGVVFYSYRNQKVAKDQANNLLLNILPLEVADELKRKGYADARHFDNVTVFFSDFKSFTTISEKLTPQELVNELNECFSAFDKIISKYGIEKIKTLGDAYLAVSGLPLANPNHAEDVTKAALEIQQFMADRKKQNVNREGLYDIRVGVNSGSVVAGIVGVKKFAYDIWGDTVNTAARMEQNGEAGKVNISEATYELVKDKFNCEYRGEIEAKNKGKLKMYFVS